MEGQTEVTILVRVPKERAGA